MIRPTPRIFLAAALAPLLLAVLAGCRDEEAPAVTVGPVAYPQDVLLGMSEERRETLADLVAFGLAVSDSSTTVLGAPWIATKVEDRLLEILAAELTLEGAGVGEEVLRARYHLDPAWELTVRHILFFSERWRPAAHRAEAEAKAARAMGLLRGGADFAVTAASLSEEPGAEGRQGLLTPGREGSWVPEFWAAALALQPGEISPVTETQYGFHILRLEGREVVPFEEARSVVARAVAREIGDPVTVLDGWIEERGGAGAGPDGRRAALAEAGARGLGVPEAERAEIARAWDDLTYRWSSALGFVYGAPPERVRADALAALGRPGQNAGIARDEMAAHRALLRAPYAVAIQPLER